MDKRFNFTIKSLARTAVPENGRSYYYDTKVLGLTLSVTPTGTKSFL